MSVSLVEGIVEDLSSRSLPGASSAIVIFSYPHKTIPVVSVTAETQPDPIDSGEGNVNCWVQSVTKTQVVIRVSEEFRGKLHIQAWSKEY